MVQNGTLAKRLPLLIGNLHSKNARFGEQINRNRVVSPFSEGQIGSKLAEQVI